MAGAPKYTLSAHTGAVTCVDFLSSDELLLTGSSDKSIIFWEMKSGRSLVGNIAFGLLDFLSMSCSDS